MQLDQETRDFLEESRKNLVQQIIGQTMINSIVAGQILGHVTVAGQAVYDHNTDPFNRLVTAFGRGRLDDAIAPLEEVTGKSITELGKDLMEQSGKRLGLHNRKSA